jgi:hypothetical protein
MFSFLTLFKSKNKIMIPGDRVGPSKAKLFLHIQGKYLKIFSGTAEPKILQIYTEAP